MVQQLATYTVCVCVCQIPSIVGEVAHAKADGEIDPARVNANDLIEDHVPGCQASLAVCGLAAGRISWTLARPTTFSRAPATA